ncbi:coatomer subunit gamma [Puccinia graminis f. sp. tritici]|uniref:Coatomer subunit gamma n=2 Tax=Puccinia graminis f. sp. tritici TaxID=56615 RepID=A0A5B0LM72_PUCGR|nr:coatomer subunit gamma [Puccinia graminis f. sp. tritici]KAA1090840.1 coatomer subunit gamma [Puccinia graminis f. sp. tritici]KAA1110295.1 coatomer subunit gamma [Puccinia graminis f. sp. tritici]
MSFKKDEETGVAHFMQDKTTVIQEARVFNESPISPRKCRILLTKIIYLLYVGETFGPQEATTLFFGVTKLFQHKDSALRQMVYLVIKELSDLAQDVIMVTSSIMKDMQPNLEVIYRPNAIRALCRVIDGSMIQGIERFYKSAIVDRNSSISSAALVSSYHLFPLAKDVIKRWANEAQESLNAKGSGGGGGFIPASASSYLSSFGGGGGQTQSGYQAVASSSYITQYHALGLLYAIRQQDRMAVSKLIQQLGGGKSNTLRSPYALCMLIRFASKIMDEDPNLHKQMHELLEGFLRHKSDMVNYEAARAICEMRNVTSAELYRPVAVLQLFLSSPKGALKFCAIRTLAKLALTHPQPVQACNLDMERLINDDNRGVATFAITTLLKTGNEASVDRLMKQISAFMSEISDEFKVTIVNAIRALCLKFPAKQAVMLNFLSGILRDEGGYDFKRAVVEAIFDMIKFIGESKETALAQLCEFIEDCEFTKLSVRILHLLGIEGPKALHPSKYIRYIYNRVILENAIVRAAAVSSLAKFGVNVPDPRVKASIKVLLTRCLDDVDDEVRDRAALYLKVLDEEPLAEKFVKDESTISLATLESKLTTYISQKESSQAPFEISSIPRISREQACQEALRARQEASSDMAGFSNASKTTDKQSVGPAASASTNAESQREYATQLSAVPEFSTYGKVFKSSAKPIPLTEHETEYVVSVVKHIFAEHVVFQFNLTNTLPDTILEQVSVLTNPPEEGLTEDFIIPIPKMSNEPGIIYVSYTRSSPENYALGSFNCTLKFISKEVDPISGEPEEEGYEDEYQIEDVELGVGDYIIPTYLTFTTEWDRLRTGATATETFQLSALKSLKSACDTLIELLNMEPLGGSENPSSTTVHTLQLAGILCGGEGNILVRTRMTFSVDQGVTIEMSARAEKPKAVQLVMSAIA